MMMLNLSAFLSLPLRIMLLFCFYGGFITSLQAQGESLNAESVSIPKYFYKKLIGNLGEEKLEIDLLRLGSNLQGHFYFHNRETKGTVEGTIDDKGRISLNEIESTDPETGEPKVIGIFEGRFASPTEIAGSWHALEGNAYNTFKLEERYPQTAHKFWVVHEGRSYSGTAEVELVYVVMGDEQNAKAARQINQYINSHILNYDHPKSDKSKFGNHAEFLDDFVSRYKAMAAKTPADALPIWENKHHIILDYNNHDIVVLEFVENIFEGGLRPEKKVHYVNFDAKSGNPLTLEDIFVPNFENRLNQIAEPIFRKRYGFENIKNFSEEGIIFPDNKFSVGKNFALSKGGILFCYNAEEIAPHALGEFEIFVPFSRIKDLIKKGSLAEVMMNSYY
jgi:hypothetical protein